MESSAELCIRSRAAIGELLLSDSEMALTFLDIADTTRIEKYRMRRRQEAAKAYHAIYRLLPKAELSDREQTILKGRLRRIRSRLAQADRRWDF